MGEVLPFQLLQKKLQQQEETISQLIKIIATTNRRVSEIQFKQEDMYKKLLQK